MEHIIVTENLSKKYGTHMTVKDLDLKVPQYSIYGFLGPNGAGKSTTMKMLLGLIKPTKGNINVFETVMNRKNRLSLLKETGSLIESPSYYGHLSGRENLEILAILKQVSKHEIDEVLSIVRMEHHQHKKASQYSLGMKQRLGLAGALLGKPRLLLLDEPTNGLDPAGIQEMRDLIKQLPERYDMTILISSHLLSEMDQMATHVGIIDRGELIFQDSMEHLHQYSKREIYVRMINEEKALPWMKEKKLICRRDREGITIEGLSDNQIAAVIKELSSLDAGIIRVEEHQKNLEDVFLSLTGKGRSL